MCASKKMTHSPQRLQRYGESFNPYAINPNTGSKYSDDMLAAIACRRPFWNYY